MNGFEMILPFLKPIEHLIRDDSISEVMVNGHHRVFVEKAGFVEEVRGLSIGEKSLMVAVKNIARRLGDDISESKPILDSRLPDGSRVAVVIPPCSLNGITLTIRKFNARHFGIDPEKLTTSAFVGFAILSDVRPYTREDARLLKKKRAGYGWFPRNFSWVLKKARRISPIKAKGQLSLFDVPRGVERQVRMLLSR